MIVEEFSMRPFIGWMCWLVLSCCLIGCSSDSGSTGNMPAATSDPEAQLDRLVKERIPLMNELAKALDTDEKQEKIKALEKRLETNDEQIKAVQITEDAKSELLKKHEPELSKATEKWQRAKLDWNMKQIQLPGGGK
jgi:hypothetical protein